MSWSVMNPWALFALGALALPLAIHLLNRHRGQRVWVGNIALYRQPRRQRLLALRLYQPGLLALRLMVLTLLALLLAGLSMTYTGTLSGAVAYVTPAWWRLAEDDAKAVLLASHDHVFSLVPDFPELTAPNAVMPEQTSDVCSLLIERMSLQRHINTVAVYGVNRVGQLPSTLCGLGADVTWYWQSPVIDTDWQPTIDVTVFYNPQRADDAYAFEVALSLIAELRAVRVRTTLESTATATDAVETVKSTVDNQDASVSGRDLARRIVVGIGVPVFDNTADLLITDRLPATLLSGANTNTRSLLAQPAAVALDPEVLTAASSPFGAVVLLHHSTSTLGAPTLWIENLHQGATGILAYHEFPDRLLPWLLGTELRQASFNHAPVAADKVLTQASPAQAPPPTLLTPWLALLVALLLLLERLWSEWYPGGRRL